VRWPLLLALCLGLSACGSGAHGTAVRRSGRLAPSAQVTGSTRTGATSSGSGSTGPAGTAPTPPARRTRLVGHSTRGRPIRLITLAGPAGGRTVLDVGCIHGTECAGEAIVHRLVRSGPPRSGTIWIVPNLNPDGHALGTRVNARGVDLNRNFPSGWRRIGAPGTPQYSGPRPLSERESRLAVRLIERLHPAVTIWFHQPQDVVRAWGQSIPVARRYAHLAGAHFRAIRWPAGAATRWQNHTFPGTAAFVVELAAGPLGPGPAAHYAAAIRGLAAGQ